MEALLFLAQDDVGIPLFFGGGLFLLWMVLAIAALLFWIWALIDAITNTSLSNNEKLIWVIVIVLTNWIGALIYLFVGRKQRALA
jgi:phospholipase D-like protein